MEDKDLLAHLRSAIERGDVELLLDVRRQYHVDSPIYRVSDSSWAIYLMMIAVAAATFVFGWASGLEVFAVCMLIYLFGVRRMVATLMRRRFMKEALEDGTEFRKCWLLKGVGFHHKATGTLCESPDGLWRSFILDWCAPPGASTQSAT